MSEQAKTGEPVDSGEPLEPVEPVASATGSATEPDTESAPAKKPVRRGRIAAIAGSVLLVGAVIGGTGYTVVTVQDADRDAGAPTWKFPKAAEDDTKTAKAASGLAAVLVPYGTDYSRGPDIDEFGYDAELSGAEATALRKQSADYLPRSQRLQLEEEIDKQDIKGMAMRSYLITTYFTDVTVEVTLSQMGNKTAVRDISTFQNEFLNALESFPEGPKVKGHKNAQCFLSPEDEGVEIDLMFCSAYEADVLVGVTAQGTDPETMDDVAELLSEQLDRITETGEAV